MSNKYISASVLENLSSKDLESLLNGSVKVLCKNFDTEKHEIKILNALYNSNNKFWNDKKWDYYILESDILQNINDIKKDFNGFTDNYSDLVAMSEEDRLENLKLKRIKLKEIALKRTKENEEISKAIVEGTTDTIMLNKVIFDDLMKLPPETAKLQSKVAVDETSEIVKVASNLLGDYTGDLSIFNNLIEKSNGSTIKHMTRTFVMTLSYFKYYNILLNSGYASKIRVAFNSRYKDMYQTLLPDVSFNHITLEKVFKGGMATIPELETNAIGVGFLLHDIGKQVDLEYFEGSEGYVKERIQAHVSNGFNELLKRTVYPPVVSAIAGFHHEYYGDSSGYGPLREFIQKRFPEGTKSEYCISYSLKDVYNGEALCFFPAKMLEIVDVYDALTDPGRKYRSPLKPFEAISFIRDHFLKEKVKVDPILFDMFELYLIAAGEIDK